MQSKNQKATDFFSIITNVHTTEVDQLLRSLHFEVANMFSVKSNFFFFESR